MRKRLVVLLVFALRSEAVDELDEQGRLIQRGVMSGVTREGTFDVIYPRPYKTPPELTWPNRPLGFKILEERRDGFRIQITRRGPHDLPPRWEARGIPASPGQVAPDPGGGDRTWG